MRPELTNGQPDHSRWRQESEGWRGEEDTVQWDTKATGWEAEDPVFSPGTNNYLRDTRQSFHFSELLLDHSANTFGAPTLCEAWFEVLGIECWTRQRRCVFL